MAELYSLEFLCADVRNAEKLFVEKLSLTTVATCGQNVVLQRNEVLLVLRPATCEKDRDILHKSGTICNNVVFKVPQLHTAYDKATRAGAKVVHQPRSLTGVRGTVDTFTISSPFNNVTHTVVNTAKYSGVYLPGYELSTNSDTTYNGITSGITHVDHIAYACNTGSSESIVKWYEDCLGFARFRLGAESDELTVDCSGGGLKLLAMEYWHCAEKGVRSGGVNDIKLVLVESLPNSGRNQVSTFLSNNNGPGVQHIAFHTSDIISTTARLRKQGLSIIFPPVEYYSLPIASIVDLVGHNLRPLQENGVLLDAEVDESSPNSKRHLMQVFTRPLFDRDTFFVELIQRCGATGFGAANITALYHALELHLKASGQ